MPFCGCNNQNAPERLNTFSTWNDVNTSDTAHDAQGHYEISDTLGQRFNTRLNVRFNPISLPKRKPPSSVYLEQPIFDGYANGMTPLGQGSLDTIKFAKTTIRLNEPPIPIEYMEIPLSISRRSKAIPNKYDANFPFRIRKFSGVDGMLSGYSKPAQDSTGVLWFNNGPITSFDGANVIEYIPKDGLLMLASPFVHDIKNRFWFTTDYARDLMVFDGERLKKTDIKDARIVGTDISGIPYLKIDSSIYALEENQLTPVATDFWIHYGIKQCIGKNDGTVYFAGPRGHLGVLKTDSISLLWLGEIGRIQSLAFDQNETIWLAADSGLIHLTDNTYKRYNKTDGLASNQVRELLTDQKGRLWISYGSDGIDLLDKGNLYHLACATSYSDRYVFCGRNLFEDQSGNIWVNSSNEGLLVIDESFVKPLKTNNRSGRYKEIMRFEDKLWLTDDLGIYLYDELTQKVLNHKALVKNVYGSNNLSLITFQDEVWIAKDGYRNLWQLKGNSLYKYGEAQGVNKIISDMVVDHQGVLWLGGPEGLLSYDGKHFKDELPHLVGHVNTLSLTKDKRVLVSHTGMGVLHQTDTGWNILPISTCLGFSPWATQYLGDNIYVTSTWSKGLYVYNDSLLLHLGPTNGLADATCPVLVADNERLWVGTYSNLQYISIDEIRDYFCNRNDEITLMNIQDRDGIETSNFEHHNGSLVDSNRTLLVYSTQILDFQTSRSNSLTDNNQVALSWLEVYGKTYNFQTDTTYAGINWSKTKKYTQIPDDLELDYTHNQLNIGFQYLDYSEPFLLKYRYRISNLDESWRTSNEQSATFTNLPPGEHRFEVQAFCSNLKWSKTTLFTFTVFPPWYRTTMAYIVYALIFGLIILFVVRWRTAQLMRDKEKLEQTVSDRTADLVEEKRKSDDLLLNILPEEIAEELKAKGHAEAKGYDIVSVIFTDFVGFTAMSARLEPEEVVERINACFKGFDLIMEKYGIEKIKTIGDAYMAASGLPKPNPNAVENAILAALEMQEFISKRQTAFKNEGKQSFVMRLGIHTGPVVAGIVGVKKFQYDIWGDTVNTAARMESNGEMGKVNISNDTYLLVKNNPLFVFEHRGKLEAKGKGKMDMWFVGMA